MTIAHVNAQQHSCTFPGVKTQCVAQSGEMSVEWREQRGDQRHRLFLRGGSVEKPILIHHFDRSVDVLWSPTGRALAITDHAASTDSNVWVITLDAPDHPANLEHAFTSAFGLAPDVYRNSHRYFHAIAWRSSTVLEFVIRAYDGGPDREYNARFLYNLDGTMQRH